MARAKQYAERVNIVKKVRVAGKWKLAAVVEQTARSSAIMSGSPVARSIILKAGTT